MKFFCCVFLFDLFASPINSPYIFNNPSKPKLALIQIINQFNYRSRQNMSRAIRHGRTCWGKKKLGNSFFRFVYFEHRPKLFGPNRVLQFPGNEILSVCPINLEVKTNRTVLIVPVAQTQLPGLNHRFETVLLLQSEDVIKIITVSLSRINIWARNRISNG